MSSKLSKLTEKTYLYICVKRCKPEIFHLNFAQNKINLNM